MDGKLQFEKCDFGMWKKNSTKTIFWLVKIVWVRYVIINTTEANILACKLLHCKNVIKISRNSKNWKMGYKISKLGDWSICLEGAELGASFQEKWFNFQFCVIQLGKCFCKFKCNHTGKSDNPSHFRTRLWYYGLLNVLRKWRSQEAAANVRGVWGQKQNRDL